MNLQMKKLNFIEKLIQKFSKKNSKISKNINRNEFPGYIIIDCDYLLILITPTFLLLM